VRAFRADPEVAEALAAARVDQLALPTLGEGETLDDLRAEAHDREAMGRRGMHFERLDQLAMEHLLGVR
jgi:xylose isomerase